MNVKTCQTLSNVVPRFCAFRHQQIVFASGNKRQLHDLLKLVKKLDNDDKVVTVDKKDLRINYSAGQTKGGQHANNTYSAVTIYHIPTKITRTNVSTRNQKDNEEFALAELRKAVDIRLKGDESEFVKIEQELLKQRQLEKQRRREELEKLNEQKENLKRLLSEEDTLKY